MPTVTITHPSGSTETIDETQGWTWERKLGEMFKLTIKVDRDDAKAVTLNRKDDEVELAGVTTGRLVDVQTGGSTWRLICYSFEWDGKTEEPTGAGVKTTDTDDALVTSFIGDVSTWSAGTINTVSGTVELTSNHAQPHERLRRLEQQTAGELRFNADKTVDYVDKLGSDKTGSITLSPSNANFDGDISVENRGRVLDATHVKVLGAHEGEAQFYANLVPSSDGRSYDNRVNYSTSRWSSASDDDWARWSNKEAASQSSVDATAAALGEEITETHIDATATVVGEDLVLGDRIHVAKAGADIDRDMRVVKIVTKTLDDVPAATVDEVTLSTRSKARQQAGASERDIARFNVAFQGSAIWGTPSGGVQAVDSGLNYQLPFFYPDVEFEHTVKLYVASLPYRVFHSGGASVGNASFVEYYSNSGSASGGSPLTLDSGSVGASETGWPYEIKAGVYTASGNTTEFSQLDVTVREQGTAGTLAEISPEGASNAESVTGVENGTIITQDLTGKTLELRVAWPSLSSSEEFVYSWNIQSVPPHTHEVNPGVTEFPSETASGADVLVNGTEEATDIGTGAFETTVDLAGTLTKGQFNTVEVASNVLGLMLCTMGIQAYWQQGTQ